MENSFGGFGQGKDQDKVQPKRKAAPTNIKETKLSKGDNLLPKDKIDRKMVILIGGAIVAVLIALSLVWFLVLSPSNSLKLKEKETIDIIQQSGETQSQSETVYIEEITNLFPRSYQPWEAENEELLEDRGSPLARNIKIDVFQSGTSIPRQADGYTDDLDQLVDSEGNLNPMFTSITEETFFVETARIIEMFLNPVFGGWEFLQYPMENEVLAGDMMGYPFTSRWTEENMNNNARDVFPVFSDVNNDNYGLSDQIRADGPRWIGDLVSGTLDMFFNDDTLQYEGDFVGNVKFLSFGKDDAEILEKDGVLSLRLITDENGEVLVDNASLEILGG